MYYNVLQKFELKYSDNQKEKVTAENNIRYLCENSNMLNHFDNIIIDDIIKGEYKGLPFTIYDTNIYYNNSDKKPDVIKTFNGIILATKSNKNFKCETLIKTNTKNASPKIGQKSKVNLEDTEFENLFDVYSTDQIEARYLLTTSFMERLKKFKKLKQYTVEVLFSKRTYMGENIFFFLNTGKDHFEVDINQNLLDKNALFEILWETSIILKVIDALKLDQNIGL